MVQKCGGYVRTKKLTRYTLMPLIASWRFHCIRPIIIMLCGETGRHPLFINTWTKCIKYWLRLLQLPMSRLRRQTYEMLLIQQETGKQNWAYFAKKILTTNGFGIVWLCQGVGYQQTFISEFKDRLIATYKQD
eukprot:TRINITY_DN35214_c0_g2_i3.p1 TRINITY_DN35214_c0_g2~~TRINITY_DN35214_c0_g2_i3.p1  ORF type:complete len:133 (+),score=1.66 TRINITY_DN35214_c0_g2_i3:126-524(+)